MLTLLYVIILIYAVFLSDAEVSRVCTYYAILINFSTVNPFVEVLLINVLPQQVVSPFPPSDKIGIKSVQRETEEILPMKQMKMDWVPYIPLEKRS